MTDTEIRIPDIGDFENVPIIEILVKAGDAIEVDQPLITLESDKAIMEVPSPIAGVLTELKVTLGSHVSEGDVIALIATEARSVSGAIPDAPSETRSSANQSRPSQPLPNHASSIDEIACDLLVLGAGPGGYSAAFRGADLGLSTVLVERYSKLGGVCLNVGCIPSKALLHVATDTEEAMNLAAHGVTFGAPQIDLDSLRDWKEKVVCRLAGGIAAMAKMRNVSFIQGIGRFRDAHSLEVTATGDKGAQIEGPSKVIRFTHCIIAAGSRALRLPFLPNDPRIVSSTGALELHSIPSRMLVIGGGIIGLEKATVYSALGARIDVVEALDGLMQGPDRDLVAVWQKHNARRFDRIMLRTRAVAAEAKPEGIWVQFEGENAPERSERYDLVLEAVGRRPNGHMIGAETAGVSVDERGFIPVDRQMRTSVRHIFAIGDLAGPPMLAHKAVHEAHIAAEAVAGFKSTFDARAIPGVAYTNPEVAWVGVTEVEAKINGTEIGVGRFPWNASGRAIANGRDEGFTKLIFDKATGCIIGGGIVGPSAGDMIGELALAIEMGADAIDIGATVHPHPTLGETIGMAAEVYEGVCTDLPKA
jgi:dihydrolipoamide dehydrogenase